MNGDGSGDFLARLSHALERASIPHMVVGSFASSFHGIPRSSHDLDLVIDPNQDSLKTFVASLPKTEYYADSETALDALKRRGQFNVIDMATGWKADLIIRKPRPFSTEELQRRTVGKLLGVDVPIASAEDTILTKLEWSRAAGGSDLQLKDASGVVQVQAARLDVPYIERWAPLLGVEDEWARVRR